MVSIVTCTMREEYMENVFRNYKNQKWTVKELIIILNKDTMNIDKWKKKAKKYKNVYIFQLSEGATLGDCLNFGIKKAKYDYIAKFDDDDYYGPAYLKSAMKAFNDEEVSIVGKSSYYIYFKNKGALILVNNIENAFTDTVAGATLVFKKEVFNSVRFEKRNRAEDYFFIEECQKNGMKIYSSDRNDFAVIRHEPDKHTWKVSDDELMEWGDLIAYTNDYQAFVSK